MASGEVNAVEERSDAVMIELPAPQGWRKTLPRKSRTPRRNEIVFIAPTGETIKSKRQLNQYLKSHPGGPPASEFDWTTGGTPRRSQRLSGGKSIEMATLDSGPRSKRPNKSSPEEAKRRRDNPDGEDEAPEQKENVVAEDHKAMVEEGADPKSMEEEAGPKSIEDEAEMKEADEGVAHNSKAETSNEEENVRSDMELEHREDADKQAEGGPEAPQNHDEGNNDKITTEENKQGTEEKLVEPSTAPTQSIKKEEKSSEKENKLLDPNLEGEQKSQNGKEPLEKLDEPNSTAALQSVQNDEVPTGKEKGSLEPDFEGEQKSQNGKEPPIEEITTRG